MTAMDARRGGDADDGARPDLRQPRGLRHARTATATTSPATPPTSSASTRGWSRCCRSCARDDLLVVTADHGNDPTTPEHRSLARVRAAARWSGARVAAGVDLGTRATFADLGQTLADNFGVGPLRARHELSARHDRCPSHLVRPTRSSSRREHPRAAGRQERRLAGPAAAGARGRCPAGVPARSRPHHPLQGVPPAEAQDAGVLRAGRRPLPDAAHAHARGVADRAHIAKVLRLHEELTEAIALGHDLGHTPFGHAGERVLDTLVPGGFNHYEQSLRIVDVLENDGRGLNLTWEVRDGIARHSKGKRGSPVGLPTRRSAQHDRRADRARRRPHRLRQPRHRRCGAGGDAECRRSAAGRRRRARARPRRRASARMVKDVVTETLAAGPAEIRMSDAVLEATLGLRELPVRGGLRERRRDRRVREGRRASWAGCGRRSASGPTSSSTDASSRPRGWTRPPGTSWPA